MGAPEKCSSSRRQSPGVTTRLSVLWCLSDRHPETTPVARVPEGRAPLRVIHDELQCRRQAQSTRSRSLSTGSSLSSGNPQEGEEHDQGGREGVEDIWGVVGSWVGSLVGGNSEPSQASGSMRRDASIVEPVAGISNDCGGRRSHARWGDAARGGPVVSGMLDEVAEEAGPAERGRAFIVSVEEHARETRERLRARRSLRQQRVSIVQDSQGESCSSCPSPSCNFQSPSVWHASG